MASSSTNTINSTPSVETSCSISTTTKIPDVYGLSTKENGNQQDVLTVTGKSIFLVESGNSEREEAVHEPWYSIESSDWVAGIASLKMQWVRFNGADVGFDSPSKCLNVKVENNELYFPNADESLGAPVDVLNGPWKRQ